MKKAAIFDMDGTMFDTERIWKENWERVIPEFGFVHNPEFPKNVCGTSGEKMLEVIRGFYPGIDAKAYRAAVRAGVNAEIAVEVPVKAGLYEIVEYLKGEGVKLAVASSSQMEKIRYCVETAGLDGKFDMLFSGTEIEHGKPAPDIFIKVAEALGVATSECYVLEDGLNGVYAGIASGADTIMIIDLTEPDERAKEGCVGIYNSLLEVMDAMQAGDI
ncbi:MAG: HAD family phosphatase [Lachnospiraceae bacterium]|nr:HAD family phosphatase [Lachnospiraceae bacterium]